jgi:hypothetical protein
MCDPISIAVGSALGATGSATAVGMVGASTLLGAGSSIAGYAGQRQQAKQQAAYQAQSAAAERQRALQEQTSIRMRQAQEQEATARELEQVSRKSQEALARARVSAGEAGVAGASVQALMDDYTRQEAGYRSALARQQELSALGTQLGLEQAGLASQQRLISIQQPIDRPSFLTAGLGAISGGLSGYRTGLDIGSRMGTPSPTGMLNVAPKKIGMSNIKYGGGYKIL